eukprot:gene16077-7426_t
MVLNSAITLVMTLHTHSEVIAQDMDLKKVLATARSFELTNREIAFMKQHNMEATASPTPVYAVQGKQHLSMLYKDIILLVFVSQENQQSQSKRLTQKKNLMKIQSKTVISTVLKLAAVTTPVHAIQSKKLYPDTMVQVKFDGGTKLRMQIDTGADANIIDESLYHQLHPKPELRRTRQAQAVQLSTHSGKGSFQTQLTANGKQAIATVYVVPGSGPKPLIGKYTAFDLSLLSITVKELTADMQDMHHVLQERKQGNKSAKATTHVTQHMSYSAMAEHLTSKKSSKQRLDNIYKHKQDATDRVKAIVINTLGCLKRWIPFTKREQFEAILKELEDADIIEPVYGPTEWVSNVVLTPKADPSQLRMSLDVTTANTAIRRTRHVIPHWKNCDTN